MAGRTGDGVPAEGDSRAGGGGAQNARRRRSCRYDGRHPVGGIAALVGTDEDPVVGGWGQVGEGVAGLVGCDLDRRFVGEPDIVTGCAGDGAPIEHDAGAGGVCVQARRSWRGQRARRSRRGPVGVDSVVDLGADGERVIGGRGQVAEGVGQAGHRNGGVAAELDLVTGRAGEGVPAKSDSRAGRGGAQNARRGQRAHRNRCGPVGDPSTGLGADGERVVSGWGQPGEGVGQAGGHPGGHRNGGTAADLDVIAGRALNSVPAEGDAGAGGGGEEG